MYGHTGRATTRTATTHWVSLLRDKIGPVVGSFLLDLGVHLSVSPKQYNDAHLRFSKLTKITPLNVAKISRVASISARLEDRMQRAKSPRNLSHFDDFKF